MGLKQVNRRRRIIELRCMGLSEVQIAQRVGVSERTVRRDLKSLEVREFVDELKRRQLRDIAESKDIETRLKYRDKLLSKLIPKKIN